MGNLSTESPVVHQKNIEVSGIVNNKLLKSVGKVKLGSIVWAVSNFGHLLIASESSPHAVVNAWVGHYLPRGLLQLSANLPP